MLKSLIAGAAASFVLISGAYAATVSVNTSVVGEFDVTGIAAGTVSGYGYECGATCSGGNGSGDPDNLAASASILVNLGTSAGADDLGSRTFANTFGTDITDFGTGLGIAFPGSLNTIYLTFVYVDDQFDVSSLRLSINGELITGAVSELAVGEVPLPAALPLFIAGLAGMGAAARRKRKTA